MLLYYLNCLVKIGNSLFFFGNRSCFWFVFVLFVFVSAISDALYYFKDDILQKLLLTSDPQDTQVPPFSTGREKPGDTEESHCRTAHRPKVGFFFF